MITKTFLNWFVTLSLLAGFPSAICAAGNFGDLIDKLDTYWTNEDYQQMHAVAKNSESGDPDQLFKLAEYQFIALGHLGRQTEGIELVKQWHKKGYFFFLRENHRWFSNYQGFDGFHELVQRNQELREAHNVTSETTYEVVLPEDFEKEKFYPLLYVCHGGLGSMDGAKARWQNSYLSEKFITVYLQSKDYLSSTDGVWKNDKQTRDALWRINHEVWTQYRIQQNQVYIGGMSNGGMMTLQVVFEDIFHVNGFIVNCPVVPDSLDMNRIRRAKQQGKSGVFITGSNDFSLEKLKRLQSLMDEEEFPYEMTVIDGLGHEIPKDFHQRIEVALTVMLESEKSLQPSVDVTYIANEGFLFEAYGSKVLIDGNSTTGFGTFLNLSDSLTEKFLNAQPPFDHIDVMIVTHRHGDHHDPELSIKYLLKNPKTLFVGNGQVIGQMRQIKGFSKVENRVLVIRNERGDSVKMTLAGIRFEFLPVSHSAYHKDGMNRHEKVENLLTLANYHGISVLHPGDATIEGNLEYLHKQSWNESGIDILAKSYFGFQEGAVDWIQNEVKAKHIFPIHIPPAEWKEKTERFTFYFPDAVLFEHALDKVTFFKNGTHMRWASNEKVE